MSSHHDNEETTSVYEEEEEVEITDDEGELVTDQQPDTEPESEPTGSSSKAPLPVVPSSKTPLSVSTTPGKVKPSKEVRNMEMRAPDSGLKPKSSTLPTNKNPFTTFGSWTEAAMSEIEIIVPVLTGKNESTNELTRQNKPEARYWKAPIVFKHGNFTSTTIRFDNVHIPFHTGKGYGSSFVYLCLPGFAAEKFAEAGKSRRPTVVHEKSLQADRNRWWKVANKVEESFGVINAETKKFQKKSLEVIFDATSSGITASVVVSFLFKANTDSKEPLKPTTSGTIAVNLERAFISETDVSVEMPVRLNTKRQKVDPTAISKDVANDSLMKRLAELGL